MRILIASGIFQPEIGGPATYLSQLLPELMKRDFKVSVVSFGQPGTDACPVSYPVIRISGGGVAGRYWRYRRSAAKLWPGCDVAFTHSLGLPLPRTVRPRVCRIAGDQAWERAVNRGWIAQTVGIDAFQRGFQGLRASLNRALYHREARQLDGILVPSEYLRKLVIGWGVSPAKVCVAYNALCDNKPKHQPSRRQAREALGLPSDRPILLTAARLTPFKGVDHVIRAVARNKAIRLLVAGDGPARQSLEELTVRLSAEGRVQFLGTVARENLWQFYRVADYTILVSAYEGLSHVLLESLSMGTPVIASNVAGNPEIVNDGGNGWLTPYGDVEALADCLERALQPGVQAHCASGTGQGLEKFSWPHLVEQTVRLLQRAARREN